MSRPLPALAGSALSSALSSYLVPLDLARPRRDSCGGGAFEAQENWERLSDGGKASPEEPGDSPPLRRRPRGPPPPSLFGDQPDLTCLIDTNFSVQLPPEPTQPEPRHRAGCGRSRDSGYDFSRLVQRVYQEEGLAAVHMSALRPPSPGPPLPQASQEEGTAPEKGSPPLAWAPSTAGSIWSLELQGSLIVVGRSSGRLEVGRVTAHTLAGGSHGEWVLTACFHRCGTPLRACSAAATRRSPQASQPLSS